MRLVFIVIFVSAVAIIGWKMVNQQPVASASQVQSVDHEQSTVQPKHAKFLVATRTLPVGSLIESDDLTWKSLTDKITADAFISVDLAQYFVQNSVDVKDLNGAVVRHDIAAGQPVGKFDLLRPEEKGFLAAVIRPNMRAMSIKVDKVTSSSRLVVPGNYVDVILTTFQGGNATRGAGFNNLMASTILENVRVVAMDDRIETLAGLEQSVGSSQAASRSGTATLEVSPEQAQRLAVAGKVGDLLLSLRGRSSPENIETPSATFVNQVAKEIPKGNLKPNMVLMHGTTRRDLSRANVRPERLSE